MRISLSQQKGGVGKTTTTIMLAQFLAYIKKYRVLVIDVDPQCNMTSTLLPGEHLSLKHVIMDGARLNEVIKPTKVAGLHILPSHISMEDLESYLIIKADGPYRIKDIIRDSELEKEYEMILIDTPPHLGRLTIGSLVASDFVLIPLESKVYAAEGLSKLFATIAETRKSLNPDLQILGAFINRFEGRTRISRDIVQSYTKQLPDILFETKIRYNIRIEECIADRELLYTYDSKSYGAQDFASFGDEVLNRLVSIRGLIEESVR